MNSNTQSNWRSRLLSHHHRNVQASPNITIEFVRDDSLPVITKRSSTFHRSEIIKRYLIKHNLATCTSPLDVEIDVDNFYRSFLTESLAGAGPRDIYSVYINSESLPRPIFLHHCRVESPDYDALLNVLYEISQSNSSFLTHGELVMQVNIVKSLRGGGKTTKAPVSNDERKKKMTHSLVVIESSVGYCFLRALALCIYHKESYVSAQRKKWLAIRNSEQKQLELIQLLVDRYGIEKKEIVDLDDIFTIQRMVHDYKLIVIDRNNWRNIIYKGDCGAQNLYIEFDSCGSDIGHYNPIINMRGYTGLSYFCEKCHVGSNNRLKHVCRGSCKYCSATEECQQEVIKTLCSACNIIYPSNSCYLRHKENKICGYMKRCESCDQEWITRFHHDCSANRCRKCNLIVRNNHQCFIKPLDLHKLSEEDQASRVFIFFDIECYQKLEGSSPGESYFIHAPMLLICKTFCDYCISPSQLGVKTLDPCPFCGVGTHNIWGLNCIEIFGDYLYKELAPKVEKQKGYISVFAHNGKGYDFHFILQDLFKRSFYTTNIMMNGNKIMHLTVGNVSFIDSLLFFAQSLSSLPKAFGIEEMAVKGFFPHHFNEPENWMYIGPYPDRKYYRPDMMKTEARDAFEKWYSEMIMTNQVFDFKQDIIKYCLNDVEILACCCLAFRSKFIELNGLDPFSRCFTIAQVSLEVLRALYLEKETLANTPKGSYTNLRRRSRESLAWLDYQERSLKTNIIREYKIGSRFADGFSPELNTVFEYFGCYWHGCHQCYPKDRHIQQTFRGDTLHTRHQNTQEKLNYYRSRGHNVISIWGCEAKAQTLGDIDFKNYFKERKKYWYLVDLHGHADIKESFFGGRTNNIRFYHRVRTNEEIKYIDVNSLYPFVLKIKEYPIGHPIVINENFDPSLQSYFGFVKCRILPPKDLYLPLLPSRVSKRLIFTLCKACAELQMTECNHNEHDRSLIGTWTTVELKMALQQGYTILEFFEVLHYQKSSSSIFRGYIDKFLKIKHEASGWPHWCNDENSKNQFIQQVKEREDIQLDKEKIKKNPGMRFISKLLLNSLWGKLGQNPEKKQVEMIHDYDSYWKKLTDSSIEIKSEVMVTDNAMLLQWKEREENLEYGPNTSLAVASFVTSYARLELYKMMIEVEKIRTGSLLYFDTDSLVYYRETSDREIPCGDHLGQFKDEITSEYGSSAKIEEFVTCGPKNYAYKVRLPSGELKTVTKTKGITLNTLTLQMIDYEFMLEAAKKYIAGEDENQPTRVPQFNIISDSHHNIHTKYFSKAYRVVSKKRIVQHNCTFPYGFRGDRSRYHSNS